MSEQAATLVSPAVLEALVAAMFRGIGSLPLEASLVAAHLVESNLAGHDSHGVIRVAKYVDWHARGMVLANRHAELQRQTESLAVFDGGFGYGQVIGCEAIDHGIALARRGGLAAIAIRNSGHLGRIGAWAERAADAGLASLHLVNTSGFGMLVAPFGGSDRRLSANPIAAGVPRAGAQPIVLDISTAAIAEGKIQVAKNRGEPLPDDCVLDARGAVTRDPDAFYGSPPGALLAFGGHKGYGLSVFCEVLAGALTGGGTTHPERETAGRLANNMLSLVFDPGAFGDAHAFAADIERMSEWIVRSPPRSPDDEVMLPGDVERRTRASRSSHGIPLDAVTFRTLLDTAEHVGADAALVAAVAHAKER